MGSKHKISQNARREARRAYKGFNSELRDKTQKYFNEAFKTKAKVDT